MKLKRVQQSKRRDIDETIKIIQDCRLYHHSELLPFTCYRFAYEIEIDVAPNVLNIQSDGEVVTVHTDIAYSMVEGASVLLNGLAIEWWKADAQGNFVAKFEMDAVKELDGLVIGDYNLLTVTGKTRDGLPFIGTQDIKVIDVVPKGK